jgi:hypothetical protein
MQIVAEYALSDLTYEDDRPIALRGIYYGLCFKSGTCTDFFPYSLLWPVGGGPHGKPVEPTNTLPTWSCTYHKPEVGCRFKNDLGELQLASHSTYSVCDAGLLLDIEARSYGTVLIREEGTCHSDNGPYVAIYTALSDHTREWRSAFKKSDSDWHSMMLSSDFGLMGPIEIHLAIFVRGLPLRV